MRGRDVDDCPGGLRAGSFQSRAVNSRSSVTLRHMWCLLTARSRRFPQVEQRRHLFKNELTGWSPWPPVSKIEPFRKSHVCVQLNLQETHQSGSLVVVNRWNTYEWVIPGAISPLFKTLVENILI